MRLHKRVCALFLAAVLLLAGSLSAFAAVEDTGFSDVAADAWYADAVRYVCDNQIMGGTTETTFSPEGTMSRAMLATVLYRLAGSPAVTGEDEFSDTEEDAWYSDAVLWASRENIVNGYGDGLFGTDDPTTREQFAAILWRYAGSPESERGEAFADEGEIAGYAIAAVNWAQANGLINGVGENRFSPKSNTTRAQAAVILQGYVALLNPQPPVTLPEEETGKVLVVYFSWGGSTARMANYIGDRTGGELLELEPVTPYPTDYTECTEVALAERDNNERPEIANLPEDLTEYDAIFVGYPIWWHIAPMIIGSFLESYDLTGVELYPFSQSASMNTEQFENSMEFVRASAPGANVHDGLFVRASDTARIDSYLSANGFLG